MPVPATTGSLKARVIDMKIGDYIPLSYNGSKFIFSEAGKSECPVAGVTNSSGASLNTFVYMVKVAKGLLIADRVWIQNISWGTLNTSKYIERLPNNINEIPVMTSNTTPSGVASASSVYGANDAWKSFNNTPTATSINYCWETPDGIKTGWIQYQFPSERIITSYSVWASYSWTSKAPKSWTFEASNDGISWTVLHTVNDSFAWSSNERKFYYCGNDKPFLYYRLNITASSGGTALAINEFEMYSSAGNIRSLTGGSCHADASGNMSKTKPSPYYGLWPKNNEWDTYVVNFPESLIQSGKTLNDVFHWAEGVATFVQDTPVTGMISWDGSTLANNSYRLLRGSWMADLSDPRRVAMITLSASTINGGWRPAFEYIE